MLGPLLGEVGVGSGATKVTMAESENSISAISAESLISDLKRLRHIPCAGCGKPLGSQQVLLSIAIGFKDSPRCLACLGLALDQDTAQLRESLLAYILARECYAAAWTWASRSGDLWQDVCPPMRLPGMENVPKTSGVIGANPSSHIMNSTAAWDAGEMGCGDLVLELRVRMQALQPGEILQLCALDPGASQDVPAWCRLTGHTLLRAEPSNYWIKRKE
jgi:tRNA 2-thiouridine synthesizing protein A